MTVYDERKKSTQNAVTERAMPHNADFELEVIAKIIESPSYMYEEYISTLTEQDFFSFPEIYNYVLQRSRKRESISIGLIAEHLNDIGLEPLSESQKSALFEAESTTDTESLVKKLKNLTKSRVIVSATTEAARYAYANKPNRSMNVIKTMERGLKNLEKEKSREKYGEELGDDINSFLFEDKSESSKANVVPVFGRELQSIVGGFPIGVMTTILARPSMGKALKNGTKVLTNEGWVDIDKLKVNRHRVFGSDGKTHALQGVYPQGEKVMYKVAFDDNTVIECCEEHLWTVYKSGKKNSYTIDTKEIERIVHSTQMRLSLPPAPVIWRQRKTWVWEDDAYLLGVFVAGGSISEESQSMRISTWRPEVAREVAKILSTGGGKIGIVKKQYMGRGYTNISVDSDNEFYRLIKEMYPDKNLTITKKAILDLALQYHEEDRLSFIRGMCDSRGVWDRSGTIQIKVKPDITETGVKFSEKIMEVIRSMGYKATMGKGKNKYDPLIHRCICLDEFSDDELNLYFSDSPSPKNLYRFSEDLKEKICSYTRKTIESSTSDISKVYPYRKRVISVTRSLAYPCTCISVSAIDKLFITEGYSLTHNTRFMVSAALYAAIWAEHMYPGKHFVKYFSQDGAPRSIIAGYVVARYGYTLKQWRSEADTIPGSIKDMVKSDIKYITSLPIIWNDHSKMTPLQMQSILAQDSEESKREPIMVLCDYLQKYHPNMGTKHGARSERTAYATEQLYEMVRDDDKYALIMATQLPKDVDNRENKRPRMSDGKGASEIEESSEMMIGLYRDSYYTGKEDNKGEISLLKDKTGEKGEIIRMDFKNGLWMPNGAWGEHIMSGQRDVHRLYKAEEFQEESDPDVF